MEPKEFRIGNIVGRKYTNPNPKGATIEIEPCFIKAIKEENINITLSLKDKAVLSKVKYVLIEPISITEEILLKAGFEKQDQESTLDYPTWWINESEVLFEADGKFYHNLMITDDNEIKGFHHLQNIVYDLTGKELDLKL